MAAASDGSRSVRRRLDGWHITVPMGHTKAICARCVAPIDVKEPRVRKGQHHGRVCHISCIGDLELGPLHRLPGWADIPDERRTQALASTGATGEDAEMAPADANLAENPPMDIDEDALVELVVPNFDHMLRHMSFWDRISWESLHDAIGLVKNAPVEVRPAVAELRAALAAAAGDETQAGHGAAMKAFFFLDRILFARTGRSRGGQRGQKGEGTSRAICRRIRSAWAGEWSSLWEESLQAASNPGQGAAKSAAQLLAHDVKCIQDALHDQDIRAAMRSVDGGLAMAPEAKARRVLPGLFPEAAHPLPPATTTPPLAGDVDSFLKALDSAFLFAPVRRGAGPGGSIAEFWKWMPRMEKEWLPVRALLLKFALGQVSGQVLSAYMGTRILAADREETEKVRPLGLGNFLRKCVNRAKARVFQTRAAAVLSPWQYAIGGASSAETMHKTAQSDLDMRPTACLLSLDVSNAHNEFDRGAAATAIQELIPEMSAWTTPELASAYEGVYVGPSGERLKITRDRGGDQGDPMVGLIYPILYHSVIIRTEQAARISDPAARAYGYQDDLDIVTMPSACDSTSACFGLECAKVGLRSNVAKETIAPGRATDPTSLPAGRKICSRPVVLRHGAPSPVPVLPANSAVNGSQLAEDAPEIGGLRSARTQLYARIKTLVAAGLPIQQAIFILQQRVGGDYVFLARTCGIALTVAQEMDRTLLNELKQLLGEEDWTTAAEKRLFTAVRDGGLGFGSMELTCPSSFAAAWHSNLPKVCARLGVEGVAALRSVSPWVDAAVSVCSAAFRLAIGADCVDPGDPEITIKQRELSGALSAKVIKELLEDPGMLPADRACLRSSGGPGAGAWLQNAHRPGHFLTDAQFRVSVRTRLNLAVCGACACKHTRPSGQRCGTVLDSKGAHARSCPIGGWRVRRHDALRNAVQAWCEEQGCQVEREPAVPGASETLIEARMDLIVRAPNIAGPLYLDVTIVSATSREALGKGSANCDGAAAQVAARRKREKYPLLAVTPFVVEEHGRLGSDAIAFARKLAPTESSERVEALRELYQTVASTVQRLSANGILAAVA
jgi:hypothetical protein